MNCDAATTFKSIPLKRRKNDTDKAFLAACNEGLEGSRRNLQKKIEETKNIADAVAHSNIPGSIAKAEDYYKQAVINLDAKEINKAAENLNAAIKILEAEAQKEINYYRCLEKCQRKLIIVLIQSKEIQQIKALQQKCNATNRQLAALQDQILLTPEEVCSLEQCIKGLVGQSIMVLEKVKKVALTDKLISALQLMEQEILNRKEALEALKRIPSSNSDKTAADIIVQAKHENRINILEQTKQGYELILNVLHDQEFAKDKYSLAEEEFKFGVAGIRLGKVLQVLGE